MKQDTSNLDALDQEIYDLSDAADSMEASDVAALQNETNADVTEVLGDNAVIFDAKWAAVGAD